MARFLSPEWFREVDRSQDPGTGPDGAVVIEQVVEGTPDGRVAYRVELTPTGAAVRWPVPADAPAPDLRVTCEWATAVGLATGALSTTRALMEGRLRVGGNASGLAAAAALPPADPVPALVRQSTTY